MNFDTFVGPAYPASASLQDDQRSINWFVEVDSQPGAKTPTALLGVPGLFDLGQNQITGEVRGMYSLGSSSAILRPTAVVVVGSTVFIMATNNVIGTNGRVGFSYQKIGTLNSSSGPVSIADNANGNTCVIVDGATLYVINLLNFSFTTSTDPAFLGSNIVIEIDGWFVFAKPNSQIFYTSPLYWNGVTPFDATYFALKDDAHDPIVTMAVQNRLIWLIGTETTEVWYNAGNQFFPFSRLQGTMQQVGSAATFSIARHDTGLMWLGSSERGNNEVYLYNGYSPTIATTPAISYQLNKYSTVADARAYIYTEEGHTFYVLILPTANVTWVFDLTTREWHQRASFDPATSQFNRQRANCMVNLFNMVIVGDYKTGQIYQQSRSVYTDGNYPLVSVRRAPHMWDKGNRARIRYVRLQLEFKPGSAPQTGTYTNPQATLTWSDDGGQTFSNEHQAPIGAAGQTKNRVMWRRLGIARDRIFEVRVSDPVNRDIIGASVMGVPYAT